MSAQLEGLHAKEIRQFCYTFILFEKSLEKFIRLHNIFFAENGVFTTEEERRKLFPLISRSGPISISSFPSRRPAPNTISAWKAMVLYLQSKCQAMVFLKLWFQSELLKVGLQ